MLDSQLEEVGKILSEKRSELDLSQSDVTEKLNAAGIEIIQKTYSNYELGKVKNPKPTVINALASILNIPNLNDLYFGIKSSKDGIKEGEKKEVIPLGKHTPLRLTADQYGEAFGDWQGLPMYNTPVTATFVETYRDESFFRPQYYLHDPRFRDCDFGAIITGDSMHSEIRHGDFIACKEVKDTRFIVYGDIYYVVATNGLETCKYVNEDPKNEDILLLVPRNEKMSVSKIPKDMILKMYKVRGIVRGY